MQKISKIALMMGNNSFIGREYASNLIINNINFEILIFGKRLILAMKFIFTVNIPNMEKLCLLGDHF